MQGIPKTYKFKRCTFEKLLDVMYNNNSVLYNKIEWIPGLDKCYKFLIYKNDTIIGYICFLDFKKFTNYLINIADPNLNYDVYFNNILNYFKNQNLLYISAFEIFNLYKSFNTLKHVFNMIKKYAFNKFLYIICYADSKIISRLYRMCGFIELNKFDFPEEIPEEDGANILMYLDINQTDYYKVTEKLKNKYKKNLFENMKDTKKLYESIMSSVAKEVKKAINEDRFGYEENNYHEDELDIQGDTEEWESVVKEYLWNHIDNSADTTETLGLFATLVYLDQLDIEEIKDVAESIMDQIDEDEAYENPPVDEVFFAPIAEILKDCASDWCADVINEWKLN